MDINLELYKVFYQVAKQLSFSKASRALYISQSAVSQSIKTLEEKLDTTLFIRSTKKVYLTPQGKLLLEHIEPAINLMINGHLSLLESPSLSKGKLHIGASDTICKYYLIPYLKEFHQNYPNVHLQVTNRTSTACVKLLKQGSVDFIVTNLPNEAIDDDLQIIPTITFNDVFIAGQAFSHLEGDKLTLNDLAVLPILMLEKNTATTAYMNKLFNDRGMSLKPSVELGSIDLLVDLAKIGLGISFVPEYCLSENDCEIFKIKLKETLPSRQLAIVTSRKTPLSLASQKFIEMVAQFIES
ncbi:MAG: LysR family transcriptional regulator [Firmicutes bacterium HGW-Firmicutes-1]|jgi:DNA-binding transcriptional LysR family regulator|nr:MAG: LysR family transcriptional regulator [Firmicutes bacterium HGW-Firmicutes-1]